MERIRKRMRIEVYKNPHVKGIVPRKIDPINTATNNMMLLYNSDDGFSVAEVIDAAERFFMCPGCNSSIKVKAEYIPSTRPRSRLQGVINADVPIYSVERTEGHIYYKWICCSDKGGVICSAANDWRDTVPPALKPISSVSLSDSGQDESK